MKHIVGLLATGAILLSVGTPVRAESYTFTSFNEGNWSDAVGGSVHGRTADGTDVLGTPNEPSPGNPGSPAWRVMAPLTDEEVIGDQEIVDLGGDHGRAWRYSPGADDGSGLSTPRTPPSGIVAGETGAVSNLGMGDVTHSSIWAQFDLRSVTGAAQTDGERLAIYVGLVSGERRQSLLRIRDVASGTIDPAGFDLALWNVTTGSYDAFGSPLSYTDWHTLAMEIQFNDGADNDVVNIYYVNDDLNTLVHTGPSFEEYYRRGWPLGIGLDDPQSVDRLMFNVQDPLGDYLNGGFYIDNVFAGASGTEVPEPPPLEEAPALVVVPEPTSMLGFLTAMVGLGGYLRRRRTA